MTRGEIARGVADVAPAPSVVSIGFFDGVHRGHQTIIQRAVRSARDLGVRSVVVTFDRHPMEVVNPGSQPRLLMTLPRRARTLAEQGVDVVVVLAFDDALRHLSPEEFVAHVLAGPLQAQRVVVGANFRFGHRAAGDVTTLNALGPAHGFSAEAVTLLEIDGVAISSSEIRAAIDRGEAGLAARMLGRPYAVDGIVVRGDQRGAGMGYPTANVQLSRRVVVPATGIYAGCFFDQADQEWPCVTNVGVNPTFGGQELRVEAHLLDFEGDLYGTEVAVDFRHRLRGEQKFDSVEALVRQIDADAAEARRLLGLV